MRNNPLRTSKIAYQRLTTMNAWKAAAIEKALEMAIENGAIDQTHGDKLLQEFRTFSQPDSVIVFRNS